MARSLHNPNANLRDELHADLADFVAGIESRAMEQGDTALATEARRVHQRRLDALLDGSEVRGIPRFDLPLWHAESTTYGGDPGDRFTLGRDDILRPDKLTPKFIPPYLNRAQRRAMGQRRGNGHHNGDTNGQI